MSRSAWVAWTVVGAVSTIVILALFHTEGAIHLAILANAATLTKLTYECVDLHVDPAPFPDRLRRRQWALAALLAGVRSLLR